MRGLAGMVEYAPGEFVFTARAGTPLAEIRAELREHGQYLPFDPPLVEAGATLGGTVATGLSGSGRHRYGGLRDFLLGARFVDGQGRLIRSGGKVVKNAAGFDLHKLLIGSLGRLGVLVEVSFKVFPEPKRYTTVRLPCSSLEGALQAVTRVGAAKFDLEALDICCPAAAPPFVLLRLGGMAPVLGERAAALCRWLAGGEVIEGEDELAIWQAAGEFAWAPAGWAVVKTPVTLAQLPTLDQELGTAGAHRRYVSAGNLAWIAWPGALEELHQRLVTLNLAGLAVSGEPGHALLGIQPGAAMVRRAKATFDPSGKFAALE